jgi:hypothetical protein
MSKSLDDKVIKSTDNGEYIYNSTEILRPLTNFLNKYHSIEYKNVENPDDSEWRDQFNIFLEQNKQEIVKENTIVYNNELDIADEISIITKRTYEDGKGIPQTNYYFYNYVDYEGGLSHRGVVTDESKYGTMFPPFKYLKNSNYYAESLRMAVIAELGGLGEDVQGKFLIDTNGKDLISPTFPIKVWFEDKDTLHARYPRFSDGKIYNTKKVGIEHTYLL